MTEPLSLQIALAPVPESDDLTYVLVRIAPQASYTSGRRPPLNFGIAFDRSSSMAGKKLQHAKDAACAVVDLLSAQDTFSLVAFDTDTEVVIAATPVTDPEALKQVISGLRTGDMTALHAGWASTGIEVGRRIGAGTVNRIVLLTDGIANVGEQRPEILIARTRELAKRGITTSTIGLGQDFNEDLLIAMAEAGGGNAAHIALPSDLEAALIAEVKDAWSLVGHAPTLKLKAGKGLQLVQVLNHFPAETAEGFQLSDLRAGIPINVMAVVAATEPAGELEIMLEWTSTNDAERKSLTAICLPAEPMTPDAQAMVHKMACLLTIADLKRQAVQCLDAGRQNEARGLIIRGLALAVETIARIGEDHLLRAEMKALDSLEAELIRASDVQATRKQLTYQIFATNTQQFPRNLIRL
ncbi:MAG: VWA domain-containing protein [Blastocatellia bacterium]|nr:VWA domain-containing protein [Blastocatellia bacterium]